MDRTSVNAADTSIPSPPDPSDEEMLIAGELGLRLTAPGAKAGPQPTFPLKTRVRLALEVDPEGWVQVSGRNPLQDRAAIVGFLRTEQNRVEREAAAAKRKPPPLVLAVRAQRGARCGDLAVLLSACRDRRHNFRYLRLRLSDAGEEHLVVLPEAVLSLKPKPHTPKEEIDLSFGFALTLDSLRDPRNRGQLWALVVTTNAGSEEITGTQKESEKRLRERLSSEKWLHRKSASIDVRADGDLFCEELDRVVGICRREGLTSISFLEPDRDKNVILTNVDEGLDLEVPLDYDVNRIEELSMPGSVDPDAAVGIAGASEGPPVTVPPPPGSGRGGSGSVLPEEGRGMGLGGRFMGSVGGLRDVPGGFAGRRGATRERMVCESGSDQSEAAVAKGLRWLALHQAPNGSWSLDLFHRHYRTSLSDSEYRTDPRGTGRGMHNDIAGTAFGVLPFLAAGITHKPVSGKKKADNIYVKTVARALSFLMSKQGRDGDFGGGMYAHGLATIAVCEAYGLTSDPTLKVVAQRAINFIVAAQDPAGGGWRYQPRQGGDTSVVGWQVMALKSGQMSGLNVPSITLKGAEKWLDSCETSDKGGYGYAGPQETPTMTAVALLCRQYMGTPRRNPGLKRGANKLIKRYVPTLAPNIYYEYYATQVMHHMGGDYWEFWNKGDSKGFKGMRDILVKRQDRDGSWSPRGDPHSGAGGRIMSTSLSLLTLEVYYRHLPLYQR